MDRKSQQRSGPLGVLSPQAWGWTDTEAPEVLRRGVIPTGVGVDRDMKQTKAGTGRYLHRRGGGPGLSPVTSSTSNVIPTGVGVDRVTPLAYGRETPLSPQAWGWTGKLRALVLMEPRYPHRRGGGPIMFSSARHGEIVIPTGVGVDRDPAQSPGNAKALSPQAWGWTDLRLSGSHTSRRYPHRRGGGPRELAGTINTIKVIPTGVGVDRELRA